ncbi:MAG TPA: tripartite tricarboxylate transporter substrate binding protein [Xanthobacteraceae bacterium]|jgi:tripartite-type tricarboxylate transporter receptor subunit TctC
MLRRAIAALLLMPALTSIAFAQQWPTRPIHAIVPLSAGSSLDIIARAVFEQVSASLGQSIIVENRPGAGNTIAMTTVARAEPDGYTILVNSSTHTLVPVTYANLPFDTLRDLVPIIPVGNVPLVLMVSASKGYKDVAGFVSAARAKGRNVNYVSGGAGSSTHFAGEAFRLAAGFEAVHIPQRGAPEALTEVLAARADYYFSPLPAALPFLQDGKLQALAVSTSRRSTLLPNAPTLRELGYPEAEYNFWIALFAPSKTPQPIVEKLRQEIARALHNPAMQERLGKFGVDSLPLDLPEFEKLLENEVTLNARLAKAVGLKVD